MDEISRHRVILKIELDCHQLDKTNQCTTLIPLAKLKEYGISNKKLYKLDGENLHETLLKLKSVLDKFS